jgi:hypothetical protein
MTFKFKLEDAIEVYRDPIGHYHHWTILVGSVTEGTIHRSDLISIPCLDGTKVASRILDFVLFHRSIGVEVSAGQFSDPIGIVAWRPAAKKEEIAHDAATDCSEEVFEATIRWTLANKPSRLLHDRGPNGFGYDCNECTTVLYKHDHAVLEPDLEPGIRALLEHSDPYIVKRAKQIVNTSISEQEYILRREQSLNRPRAWWKFWERS